MSKHALRLEPLLLAALGVLALVYYSEPLRDSDLWWHLAAGRHIVDQLAIPQVDPFGVFGGEDPVRNGTVLRGQWLGQVLLYLAFDAGGPRGVIALRAGLLVAALGLAYWRSRQAEASLGWSLVVLILAGYLLGGYTGERPQLFSFLAAGGLFALLDGPAQRSPVRWWLIPPLMLAWANLHGAFLLGLALLALWLVASLPQSCAPGAPSRRVMIMAALLAVVATLGTPNGTLTYGYLFALEGSELQQRTSEYHSVLTLYQLGMWPFQLGVWTFYLLSAFAAVGLIKLRLWREAAVIAALMLAGAMAYRYFAFLLVVASPYVARGLSGQRPSGGSDWPPLRLAGAAVLALGVSVAAFRAHDPGPVDARRFPQAASDRLRALDARGRVFNLMDWGGYLIWRNPQLRPYIDGRMLDAARLTPYTHMLWATDQGRAWFDQAGFDWVLLPPANRFSGEPYALHRVLQARADWVLVHSDPVGMLYRHLGRP